jgi:hypothetical protein
MKIVKKRMTEPGVFGLRKHQFGSHYFKKWDTALFANENFATYTTTYTYNRVLGLDFTIMFLNCYRRKQHHFLNEK